MFTFLVGVGITAVVLLYGGSIFRSFRRHSRTPRLRVINLADQWQISRYLENGEPSRQYLERVGCLIHDDGDLQALTVIPPRGWWMERKESQTIIHDSRGKVRFIEHHEAVADTTGLGAHSGGIAFSSYLVPVSP